MTVSEEQFQDMKERAESAEKDRDRYKTTLAESCDNMRAEGPYEGMGICPQLQEVTAERDRYREDRNLEKQMRKQTEGQREAFREALERIADDADCTDLAECKHVAREAIKEQP